MEPRIQYAKTEDGVSIAFTVLGSGPETLVSATNTWGDLHMYKAVSLYRTYFDVLAARGYSLVLYDSRNMGSSEHRDSDYSDRARLFDIEAVIERVGADRFDLYGFLNGSHTATAYAVAHPDRVKRLVLMQPFVRGGDFYDAVPEMAMVTRMEPRTPEEEAISRLSSASIITGFADPDLASEVSSGSRSSMSASELTAYTEATRQADISSLLPKISVPTLVVFVRSLLPALLPFTREVARLVPAAEFIETGEQGEMSPIATLDAMDTFFRGDEGAAPASRGTSLAEPGAFRTILFTDMEGSTGLTQRLGDSKAQEILRTHNNIVRDALTAHSGTEIKHTGDGIMASFTSASAALEAAVAIQKALADHNEGNDTRLRVRIGLNAGEPVAEDEDLFGTAVQLAARVCDRAAPGQILVSNVVQELAAGKGFTFVDNGEATLKGFDKPVRLHEVKWHD